jgi:hypothetical protein
MGETYSVSGVGVKDYFCKSEIILRGELVRASRVDVVVRIRRGEHVSGNSKCGKGYVDDSN